MSSRKCGNNIAIIPARGGSKRIPRKNIRPFCGKPIIAYTIDVARECGLFANIIVSTDDPEIAEVARDYGADVPFMRPPELADDFVGLLPVISHGLSWLQGNGHEVEYLCSLMATAPLLQVDLLKESFEVMLTSGASGATAVTTFPSCIFRAFKINGNGRLEMMWPENFPKRSQDFPEVFHDAGQFSWFRVDNFPASPQELPGDIVPFVVPRDQVHDIDTLEDWKVVEQIYNLRESDR